MGRPLCSYNICRCCISLLLGERNGPSEEVRCWALDHFEGTEGSFRVTAPTKDGKAPHGRRHGPRADSCQAISTCKVCSGLLESTLIKLASHVYFYFKQSLATEFNYCTGIGHRRLRSSRSAPSLSPALRNPASSLSSDPSVRPLRPFAISWQHRQKSTWLFSVGKTENYTSSLFGPKST